MGGRADCRPTRRVLPIGVLILRAISRVAWLVSAAMGLPFSSFPNVNSLLLVDDFQKPYLTVQDFLRTGLLLSGITILLIASLGYLLINLIIA